MRFAARKSMGSSLASRIVAAVFAYLIFVAQPVGAQRSSSGVPSVPISLSNYQAALTSVYTDCLMAEADQGSAASASRALEDLAPVLRAPVVDDGADGAKTSLVFVDNRPLAGMMQAASLAQATGDLTAAQARSARWSVIAGDVAQIQSSLPGKVRSQTADPGALAVQVLSGPDFASEPLPPKTIWERMGDAIQRWLERLHFPHIKGTPPTIGLSPLIPEIILIVILLAAVGVIVYFTVVWLRNSGARSSRRKRAAELDLAFTAEEKELVATQNYARLRALADEAAHAGDFRSGYRLLFLAILVYLDAEGAIRLNRSKTNWEYLRSLPPSGGNGLREILRPVVRDFDRIWYGESPATRIEFDLASSAYDAAQSFLDQQRESSVAADPGRLAATASGAEAERR